MQRRKFISKSALAALTSVLGSKIVFGNTWPKDMLPVSFTEGDLQQLEGKHPELIVRNHRPWNVETPAHLLDDKITPADKLFVRNNGIAPTSIDAKNWVLTIEGEAAKSKQTFTIDQLKSDFKTYTYQLTIECGGNGRAEFSPPAKGNQWELGAVGCPKWTGVRLKDVLNSVGLKSDAVYIGYYGADTHLSGDPEKPPISRGVPISKAMEDEGLIAWAMNGKDIPLMNGYPLRLVLGGWPGSVSGKWLNRIVIRDQEHDGAKMGGKSYRVPKNPVAPGTKVPDEDMKIIESMPVKSLITSPKTGALVKGNKVIKVRGHAWAGDLEVAAVHISIDFGATWRKCFLEKPVNRLAWQHWETTLQLPENGYYEVWARATDIEDNMQPMVVPGWNPKGYLNNACHRIAVKRT